ncbi:MAG TPA: hypothetical protein VNB90_15220 [Cytophagaceae bacterium]|jgi:hypothetical protein|nr:hypothetical protein [Cytophagaceae bacterium]
MIDIIDIKSISRISDWAELNIIYYSVPFSKAKLNSLLEDNGYEDDVNYKGDELFDSILLELKRRAHLYGPFAPYEINGNVIASKGSWVDYPEYVMCLLFSYWGAENAHSATKLFERLSKEALEIYFNGKGIVLGFPNINNLTNQLNGLAVQLLEERGGRNPDPEDKDRGVDVVGWIPFEDERNSQVIILMQCAAGRRWRTKKQIPLSAWAQYIHWNYMTTIPALSITEVINNKNWQKSVDEYGIIFDRARIFRQIYSAGYSIDMTLRSEIIAWCTNKLN